MAEAWFRKDKWEQLFRSFIWFWSWLQCHKPCYICISECTKMENEQSLFKTIFRTKYWCASVVYVKQRNKKFDYKTKNLLANVCPFISSAVFHFLSMGWIFVLLFLVWFFFFVAVYISLWQNWYLLFGISSSLFRSCPLLVECVLFISSCIPASFTFCKRIFLSWKCISFGAVRLN